MSTRVYFPSSGAAPVTPATWLFPVQGAGAVTLAAVTDNIFSAMVTRSAVTGIVSPQFTALGRWVIGPLDPVAIAGTVKGNLRCTEDNIGANATLALAVRLITPAGAARSTLLSPIASTATTTPPEMLVGTTPESGLACRRFMSGTGYAIALTSQTPTDGDYLVIELGFRSATTTSYTVYLRAGDAPLRDLQENDSDATDGCPWLEFSNTLPLKHPLVGSQSSGKDIIEMGYTKTGKWVPIQQMRIGFAFASPQNHATIIGDYRVSQGKHILFPNCLDWFTVDEQLEIFEKTMMAMVDIYNRRHS